LVFEIVNLQFWTQCCSPLPAEGPVLYVYTDHLATRDIPRAQAYTQLPHQF